jgi:hypothetical protein
MSQPLGTYSFLPWLRQGVANLVTAADFDAGVLLRAAIRVDITAHGDQGDGTGAISGTRGKDVALFGPGDIVGIEARAIVRSEPRHWITNFEPNYVPFLEFYDEDFPWRYTPAAPDKNLHRLRPWIALVVLEEGEFEEGKNVQDKPLSFVTVDNPKDRFPPADELWAWAHVHVNRRMTQNDDEVVSNEMGPVLGKLNATLDEDRDLACSRIVCPRKLGPNKAYHAFIVPVFESGRLAGLGLDPAGAPYATASSWKDKTGKIDFPYYHRWFFRTGIVGDFEYLVRLLKAKPVDPRVGNRDMDVSSPGASLPGIDDPELGGILKLGGALRVPRKDLSDEAKAEADKYENWAVPYPHDFQTALAHVVNLADDYSVAEAKDANLATSVPGVHGDPDPLITPPLYGRWHALTSRLLEKPDRSAADHRDDWVHELNLDPRHRVAAGFGTRVVQTNQEEYMNAAWKQIGDVLEANRRIRAAQLAKAAATSYYDRFVLPLVVAKDGVSPKVGEGKLLAWTAPVHRRVVLEGATISHLMKLSRVPPVVTSSEFRRAARPGARLVRSLPFDTAIVPGDLLARLDDAQSGLSVAPPKEAPRGATKLGDVKAKLLPVGAPGFFIDWLRRSPWLRFVAFIIAIVILLVAAILGVSGSALAAMVLLVSTFAILGVLLLRWSRAIARADSFDEARQTPEAIKELPHSPDFTVTTPGKSARFSAGATDGPQAAKFKQGLSDLTLLLQTSRALGLSTPRGELGLSKVAGALVERLDPKLTIRKRTLHPGWIVVPPWIKNDLGTSEDLLPEAMAYPQIDLPMYQPLARISSELFLPNINRVEPNSITLLETNPKFIEAYMVGLNHEFARELLWREYPTDQRGSYFRQFWDVSSYFAGAATVDDPTLKDKLKDIPPIDKWPIGSKLGEHDHRKADRAKDPDLVLVIRGELLKRYPNTVVYAHKAKWQTKADGSIDNTQERHLVELTSDEEDDPPKEKVRTPLYQAQVEPDIFFFGFDLTEEEVVGGSGDDPHDLPGWFFVIKERPGEPRFGFDIDKNTVINTWNDLAWEDVLPGGNVGDYVKLTGAPVIDVQLPAAEEDREKRPQYEQDKALSFGPSSNAADLAYILYQAPVLVAIHGAEMLARKGTTS